MNTKFVLYMAHCNTSVALVIDKHGEAATIVCTLFRACQHKVYVRVAVGDKTLHTVQSPALVLLVIACLEHHTLQVRTGIGLGKVHRHGFAGTHTGDVLLALLLVAKLIERFYTILQAPDVLETGISRCHYLRSHGVRSDGHVQSAIFSWHRHSPQASLTGGLKVLECFGSIDHASVHEVWSFKVNILGILFNDVCSDVACNLEHLLVVLNSVVKIHGSIRILLFVSKVALLQFYDAFHFRMIQIEFKLRMVGIIVCHNLVFFSFREL